MPLATLALKGFRNLADGKFEWAPQLNLITGANASGKTSLLEAIYFLGRGRSFRTRRNSELIRHGVPSLQLVGTLRAAGGGRHSTIGLAHDSHRLTGRVDGAPLRTMAALAAQVPVLLLNPDSHRLLDDGPRLRRRFLDWGVFHSESGFLTIWKHYYGALRQRNTALRSGFDSRALAPWDAELVTNAERLTRMRETFCAALESTLRPLAGELLGSVQLSLGYRRGWHGERELAELLRLELDGDRRQGHTRNGPHRADVTIHVDGCPVAQRLSRGQQKLLVVAMILAQATLYRHRRQQACLLLIDDLPAELDDTNRQRVMHCLARLDSQLFISAIEPTVPELALWSQFRHYRLHAGEVCQVV